MHLGDRRLHVARASAGKARRLADGPLLARRLALRDDDGPPSFRGGQRLRDPRRHIEGGASRSLAAHASLPRGGQPPRSPMSRERPGAEAPDRRRAEKGARGGELSRGPTPAATHRASSRRRRSSRGDRTDVFVHDPPWTFSFEIWRRPRKVLLDSGHVAELSIARNGTAIAFCRGSSDPCQDAYVLPLTEPANDGLPRSAGEPRRLTNGEGRWPQSFLVSRRLALDLCPQPGRGRRLHPRAFIQVALKRRGGAHRSLSIREHIEGISGT